MAIMDNSHLSEMDPEFKELIKGRPPPPPMSNDIPAARERIRAARKALVESTKPTNVNVVVHERGIPTRDGTTIAVRIYTPKDAVASPVFVMNHGGGFCVGDLDSEEVNCLTFCEELGLVVVNVDYRLAPEHPFPIGVNDAYDALKWVAANASTLNADLTKGFILGGSSSGANFAAVIGNLVRDEGTTPRLTALYLSVPAVLSPPAVPEELKREYLSHEQNKDAPFLSAKVVEIFNDAYNPDIHSPLYTPFLHPGGHKGLPPHYFQICGLDPLRDEAFLYERKLREEAGVKTKVDVYPGLPHGFWSFLPTLSSSKKRFDDCLEGTRWLLQQGSNK